MEDFPAPSSRCSSMATSEALSQIRRPPIEISLIMLLPEDGKKHCMTLLSILIPSCSSVANPLPGAETALTFPAFPDGWSTFSVRLSIPFPDTTARPTHFNDPSGQEARGQLSDGTSVPSCLVIVKRESGLTVPLAKGTPHEEPWTTSASRPLRIEMTVISFLIIIAVKCYYHKDSYVA